jgi:hypothetical protein
MIGRDISMISEMSGIDCIRQIGDGVGGRLGVVVAGFS